MTMALELDWTAIGEIEPFVVDWGPIAPIIDATNTSPIIVETGVEHEFATGNLINIVGVLGNRAANGRHQITVLDPTHFVLNDSTGDGEYAGGGTAQRGDRPVAAAPAP